MSDDDCVFVTERQWLGTVPAVLVHAYDQPFRYAEAGEPVVAAWMDQSRCEVHGQVVMTWRPVEPDQIDAVQRAIAMGCDSGCHCRCHETASEGSPAGQTSDQRASG